MAERYNNINNTSPYEQALKNSNKKIPMSNFDYSKAHYGNMNIGTLEILDCFETLPHGQYNLSMDLLLKVRVAMKKRIMTGQRVYVHAYYMSLNDLWEGAQNHIDHGRSGLLDIKKPYTYGFYYNALSTVQMDCITPNSVLNQLGAPVRRNPTASETSKLLSYKPIDPTSANVIQDYTTKINALPAIMYQRVYLDKYAPKNLLQNNKKAFPDNAEKIRVGYNVTEINGLDGNGGKNYTYSEISNIVTATNDTVKNYKSVPTTIWDTLENKTYNNVETQPPVMIDRKRFRQKKGDYFITSSPFADLLRGDAPTIDLAGFSANVDFSDVIYNADIDTPSTSDGYLTLKGSSVNYEFKLPFSSTNITSANAKEQIITALNKAKVSGNVQTQATANMLRTLIALTLIKERNALTNGDYNSMVKAQFGFSPNVDDFSPKYIGGFFQDIVFSDVTQTSESSSSSPMGNQSGQAMSANSSFIGKFVAPDYGYIMILASIVPDNVYAQGLPRFLSDLDSDDVYTSPLLNNLPPQAIKNKEIFLTNNETTNDDVFSYTQRYEHLRHRENQASGYVSMKGVALEDSAYIQMKKFTSSPQFNARFVGLFPDNVDMSIYDVVDEPPYIFNAISKVDKVEPLPYDSLPADFGFQF